MLLVFERNGQALRVELTYDHEASAYVVVVHHAAGGRRTERFAHLFSLRDWLRDFELALEDEHWVRRDPPLGGTDPASHDRVM